MFPLMILYLPPCKTLAMVKIPAHPSSWCWNRGLKKSVLVQNVRKARKTHTRPKTPDLHGDRFWKGSRDQKSQAYQFL